MQNQKVKVRRLYVFTSQKVSIAKAASTTDATVITVSRASTCC
jgi:hypothetical protein